MLEVRGYEIVRHVATLLLSGLEIGEGYRKQAIIDA